MLSYLCLKVQVTNNALIREIPPSWQSKKNLTRKECLNLGTYVAFIVSLHVLLSRPAITVTDTWC